jgi:CRP-like cAMP-binding protein
METVSALRPVQDNPWLSSLRAPRRVVARGDWLFRQGDEARAVYYVLSGGLALRAANADGDEITLDLAQAGDLVGEEALLGTRTLRLYTAVAPDRTVVAVIHPGAHTERALNPLLTLGARVLHDRMAALTVRLVEQRRVEADERVVRRVAELAACHDKVHCTQTDLAQMAGTCRATANRVLAELQAAGLVRIGRSSIEILDRERLAERAGRGGAIAVAS